MKHFCNSASDEAALEALEIPQDELKALFDELKGEALEGDLVAMETALSMIFDDDMDDAKAGRYYLDLRKRASAGDSVAAKKLLDLLLAALAHDGSHRRTP